MELCTLLIVGALIGAFARLIVPGWQPIGFIVTVLIGVLGIVGGDFIADKADLDGFVHWLVAIGISVILVFIVAGAMRFSSRR
ncbi:MAG: GlsB/YeaQ/YmgE family stress response membrane protein [Corynebacteriales bacterium]|nr:GlsB/YeaQ/YmgE family stress response membrane protein [Mycobacteriales bacterium]